MKILQILTSLCLLGNIFLILTIIDRRPILPNVEISERSLVSYTCETELVRVIDGDTVILNVDLGFEHWLHNQRFRLVGIDAPEIRGKSKEAGEKASQWLTEQIEGKDLVVQSIQNENWELGIR